MATRKKTDSWPLGTFLREARGRMSVREASRRAGISETRWRQVERGSQRIAGGVEVAVQPRPETLVMMCRAVAADERRGLELAGYNPAHYPELLDDSPTEVLPPTVRHEWFSKLSREERESVLAELQKVHVDTEVNRQGSRSLG